MANELLVASDGPTRLLTLNRPAKRNALNDALLHAMLAELQSAQTDDAVRSIVITGAGDGFCSGRDRRDVGGADSPKAHLQDGSLEATVSIFTRVLTQLLESPRPTIAAVKGYARAGGQALMLACDFVVAERTSTDRKSVV